LFGETKASVSVFHLRSSYNRPFYKLNSLSNMLEFARAES
jgi:hypothetical protein